MTHTLPSALADILSTTARRSPPPARSLDHLPDEAWRRFTHIEVQADSAFDGWPVRQRLMEQKADAETALHGYPDRAAHQRQRTMKVTSNHSTPAR